MNSAPLRLLARFVLTIALVWALHRYLGAYVAITGGIPAYVIIGALLTLMNLLIRPVLNLVTLPLKLVATILAIILANAAFLWLTVKIAMGLDPAVVTFAVRGGLVGWIVVALALGFANWLMKEVLRS